MFQMFSGSLHYLTVDHFMMVAANGLFFAMTSFGSDDSDLPNLNSEFTILYSGLTEELNDLDLGLGCEN